MAFDRSVSCALPLPKSLCAPGDASIDETIALAEFKDCVKDFFSAVLTFCVESYLPLPLGPIGAFSTSPLVEKPSPPFESASF